MSNTNWYNNSYEHCASRPIPLSGLKQYNDCKESLPNISSTSVKNNLIRSPSLDSLTNVTEQDSSLEDELSDSDSLCELKSITSYDVTCQDFPRKSDIEEFKDAKLQPQPATKAYLEQSHKSCDYQNCGFKKQIDHEIDQFPTILPNNSSKTVTVSAAQIVSKVNRPSSLVSSESNRMETIPEEPNDSKNLSVKDILAKFETLREGKEVHFERYSLLSIFISYNYA